MDDRPDLLRLLRRDRVGVLTCDGTPWDIRFVVDGADGSIVMPLDKRARDAEEFVLWTPDESLASLQMLLSLTPADPPDAMIDRYAAHHGRPTASAWARASVESARLGGQVADGADLQQPDPLRHAEAALLRTLNAAPARLERLLRARAGGDAPEPVAVAVDPDGIHVRARFGLVRLEFPRRAADPDDARRLVEAMLASSA